MSKPRQTSHASLAIERNCSVRREEYLDYMTFASNERTLFTEIFGPLIGLREEWEQQGATPEDLSFAAFRYRCPLRASIPVHTGFFGGPPEEVVEETDEHTIVRDGMGRRMKLMKGMATLPLPMDYPVKTMDDWLAIKKHYQFSEGRFREGWEATARRMIEGGTCTVVGMPGGFDEPRQLLGEEEACVSFYTQPELIVDMLETIGEMVYQVLDRVSATVQVDELFVHEDMAGKSGPLAGPKQIDAFVRPYYRKIWDMLQDRGARVFSQDSDGDMNPVLDAFIDAGINMIFPCEPAANMDIVQIRERYGNRLAFMGGIDKHIIRQSKDKIVEELEYKVPPMVKTGGCILGLDHRVPNGTPLEHYRFYIDKMWEIIEREGG